MKRKNIILLALTMRELFLIISAHIIIMKHRQLNIVVFDILQIPVCKIAFMHAPVKE